MAFDKLWTFSIELGLQTLDALGLRGSTMNTRNDISDPESCSEEIWSKPNRDLSSDDGTRHHNRNYVPVGKEKT